MDGGDWIAIAAIVVPLAYAYWVDRRAQKAAGEADARAQRAENTANDMSRSLESIAESVKLLAQAASRGATDRASELRPIDSGADAPLTPAWNLERHGTDSFTLRNVGAAPATNVSLVGLDPGLVVLEGPSGGVTLGPVQGATIRLRGTSTAAVPSTLAVACEELGTVHVAVPV